MLGKILKAANQRLDEYLFKSASNPINLTRSGTSVGGASPINTPRGYSSLAACRQFKSWAYALTMQNARVVAGTPLRLYVKKRPGQKCLFRTRELDKSTYKYLHSEATDWYGSRIYTSKTVQDKIDSGEYETVEDRHPALDIINNPNPWMTGTDLLTIMMIYLQIIGDAYIHPAIDGNFGIPAQLWPIPSQWVKIVAGGEGEDWVKGYKVRKGAVEVDFGNEEILNFKLGRDPIDVLYGQGFVESAWEELTLDQQYKNMEAAFASNLGRPDWLGFVSSGDTDTLNRLQAQINQRLSDTRNTGKFLLLGADESEMKFERLSFPEYPLKGSSSGGTARTPILETLAFIWGVPLTKIFTNKSTRASGAIGEFTYMKDTITPFLRMIEDVLNNKLLPMYGIEDDAFMAFDSVIPRDIPQDRARIQMLVSGGVLTKNELREWGNMEPLPELEDEFVGSSSTAAPEEEVDEVDEVDETTEPSDGMG